MKKRVSGGVAFLVCVALLAGCAQTKPDAKEKEQERKEENKPRIIVDNEEQEVTVEPEIEKKNILVAIDPGHQGYNVDMSEEEPNAPGSSEMKRKATTGTEGKFSGVPEYELAMDISLMVKAELEARGYDVLLTRENNDTAISNAQRAVLANDAGADISVRIHANGSEDSSVSGALALAPSPDNPYVASLSDSSQQLAQAVLDTYCETTGMANQGVQASDTMTGMNWSKIPVMILEMGYMSNEQDDLQMEEAPFQVKMVSGIVDGIDRYYGFDDQAGAGQEPVMEELQGELEKELSEAVQAGEKWSVYVQRLSDGAVAKAGDQQMESASLIKLFIASAVYESLDAVKSQDSEPGETEELLHKMITVSDNDAANTLVKRLGKGDEALGMSAVNSFCQGHGYSQTHMGRLMADFDAPDDNYTTTKDCAVLLRSFYNGEIQGAEQIIAEMKQQERKGKIPSGLPKEVVVANKTGELDDVENDAAIIYGEKEDYILCIMSGGLADASVARSRIVQLSGRVNQYIEQ